MLRITCHSISFQHNPILKLTAASWYSISLSSLANEKKKIQGHFIDVIIFFIQTLTSQLLCVSLTFTMLSMSPAVAWGHSLFLRNLNAIKHAARKDFFACSRAWCRKLVVSYSSKLRQEITTNRWSYFKIEFIYLHAI